MKAIALALMLAWAGTCVADDAPAAVTADNGLQSAIEAVRAKIIRFIVLPCGDFSATISLRVDVALLPNGDILGSKIIESSGYSSYDLAVERALLKAQPFPVPQAPELRRKFTHLDLRFSPGRAGTSCESPQTAEVSKPAQYSASGVAYPPSARAKGLEGNVLIRALVLADSTIGELMVFQSSGVPELDAAALEGVRKWRFVPAKSSSGIPTDHWVEIPIRFSLQASEKKSTPPTTEELDSYVEARKKARETEAKIPAGQSPAVAPVATPAKSITGSNGDVLLYVNDRPVSILVFEAMLQAVASKGQDPNDPKVRARVNDELISREVLVQYAVEKRIGKYPEPEEIRTIADAQSLIARQAAIAAAVLQSYAKSNPVTDKAMRSEYDRVRGMIGDKEYKASHILVGSEAEASQIIADIKAGGSFETIAIQKSLDPGSSHRGGDLGWASAARYVDPFAIALDSLKKGQVTDKPVHTQFGWHVVRVDDVRPARVPSFESIKNDLLRTMQNHSAQNFIASLRAKAVIAPAEDKKIDMPARPEATQSAPLQAKTGIDNKTEMSGVFQIVRVSGDYAEFAYFRRNNETGRREKEIVAVSVDRQADIRMAVVRKIIALIREVEQGDFLWESQRLGRNLTLSARARDNAALEDFMMREFFSVARQGDPIQPVQIAPPLDSGGAKPAAQNSPVSVAEPGRAKAGAPAGATLDDLKDLMPQK